MARRNAFRRKILDDGQQEEAMKVLKKYVQNKYRGSVLISQQDLLDVSAPQFEPLQRPQSLLIGSRNFERQSTTFSFAPQVYDGAPPLSPKLVSLDFEESKVLEDIKYDSRKDTILTYPIRVIKSLMHNQVAKQLFCLLLIAIIGLIGGAVFQSLEQPNQEYEIIREKEITMERHRNFSQEILKQLASNDCFLKMNRSKEVQITQENSYCQRSLVQIMQKYDNAFRVDHGITKQWEWDYWNSVFFAGTVFTTIGYGILAPKTVGGRIAFIVYALVSIPLLLVAMNVFGAPILKAFREKYGIVKRKIAQATRGIRRPFRRVFLNRLTTYSGILDVDLATISVAEEENEVNEVDEYENIPWQIAVIILIGFLVLCAWMFTLWEDWTFFESFYFTFTSLTTVGFGDVVPEHPRFALILFIFYTGGVFVVSTVYAYMQSKIEEKYFWALQLVDQTGQEFDLTRDDGSPVKFDGDGGVRWRSPSGAIGGMSMETGLNSEDMVLFATTPGEAPTAAPPSISTLIRQMSTKRNSMARSESKSSFCSKRRPFSNSPSASEQLTPVENKKMWPGPDFTGQASFQIGPKPSTSAPSLAPPRNLTGGGGLSVITEVSDEDTLHSRRNTRRHLSELFPKQPSSKEHNDTEEESFEMIDDKLDDAVMEDVVETATEDDTDTEKESVIPDIAITPSSSGRTRQLRRVPAQDVETPAVEHVPISLQDLSLSDEESDEQITGL